MAVWYFYFFMSAWRTVLKKILFGTTVPIEYPGVSFEELYGMVRVYLTDRTGTTTDVTESHLLLGYSPVLVGIPRTVAPKHGETICLSFSASADDEIIWRGFRSPRKALARVTFMRNQVVEEADLVVYEAVWAEHYLISDFHQRMNQTRQRLRKPVPGNVNVPGNQYDQVRSLYCVPRLIALSTVEEQGRFNLFPTDLHGSVGRWFVNSLRKAGKASEQVERTGKMVLSFVNPELFGTVHALGKNHMKEMQTADQFPFQSQRSKMFHFSLPVLAEEYIELEHRFVVDVGIHRLHFFEVVSREVLRQPPSRLACVHQFYLTRQLRNGIPVSFLVK